MTLNRNIELLAPAGSVTGLRAVIAAGADAVYIGGSRFGARAYAENPDEDDLLSVGFYDYLEEGNFLFIEWSERVPQVLPERMRIPTTLLWKVPQSLKMHRVTM